MIAGGVFLSFAFAPSPVRFLAFVGLIPLLWAIDGGHKVFRNAWLFGLGLYVPLVWWIVTNSFPLRPSIRVLLVLGVIILSGYLALFPGLFASLTKRIGLWAAPLVWPAVEVLRELTDLAFPWDLLGYTMTPWPLFTQTTSIWGVYGLGALIVLINLSLYMILKHLGLLKSFIRSDDKDEFVKKTGKKSIIIWGGVLSGTFLFIIVFGAIRLCSDSQTETIRVALIQPNVPVVMKGSAQVRDSLIEAMITQTEDALRYKPDIVLYPETATLVDLTRDDKPSKMYRGLADQYDVTIAAGMPYWVDVGDRYRFANAATLIHPDGSLDEIYMKIRLAPFGETIPFENVLPFLQKIDVQGGHHYRGKDHIVYRNAPQPLAFLICYESIFPHLTRNFVNKGAKLLCNITNDVWFGPAAGPEQHAEMAVLRAVENGVPIIRAANNGISMIIDSYGRIHTKSKLLVKTTVIGEVPVSGGKKTIYTMFGFALPYFTIFLVVLLLAISTIRKGRQRRQKSGKK